MRHIQHNSTRSLLVFPLCMFIIFSGIWQAYPNTPTGVAHTQAADPSFTIGKPCAATIPPTAQSSLFVLLDRSSQLALKDPNGYSTSVSKLLAEFWPGHLIFIPFGSDHPQGPVMLTNRLQKDDFQADIESASLGGNTPLEPAVMQTLDLLKQHVSDGSRVIILSGNTSDNHEQEQTIRSILNHFCEQGIPISTFGLNIDAATSVGKDTAQLLNDIAIDTGAAYIDVQPENLAQEVLRLYARWEEITFIEAKAIQVNNYLISVDSFATQCSIVLYRADNTSPAKLIKPDHHAISLESTDRHYMLKTFNVTGTSDTGDYTINTSSDPRSKVYVLITSPFKLKLDQPDLKTKAYTDSSVAISAKFVNDISWLTPMTNTATITAAVTLLVNGQPVPSINTVELTQDLETPNFKGGTVMYKQPGMLQIELEGSYLHAQRQTSFILQLLSKSQPVQQPRYPP